MIQADSTRADVPALRRFARSALISDALDALGFRQQCLRPDVLPLTGATSVMVGRAYTVSCVEVSEVPAVPYLGLLEALDGFGPDHVFTITTHRSDHVAVWGELVSTIGVAAGAAGVLTDGLVRDVVQVRELGFPVFARGTVPYDINGRFEVTGVGEDVEIDGVVIGVDDLIVGDADGVVVVPTDVEAQVVRRVLEKIGGESEFRRAVRDGMKPSVAYAEFGVL